MILLSAILLFRKKIPLNNFIQRQDVQLVSLTERPAEFEKPGIYSMEMQNV